MWRAPGTTTARQPGIAAARRAVISGVEPGSSEPVTARAGTAIAAQVGADVRRRPVAKTR